MDREVVDLYLDDIIPNRFQPRLNFDEQGLKELAYNIGKQKGIDVDQMFNQVKGFK